jgi:beta-lactamase class D
MNRAMARILPDSPGNLGAMDRFISPLVSLFEGISSRTPTTVPSPQWQSYFDAHRVRGTFVLFEPAKDRYRVANESRARQRFLPAATFNAVNALVGLEVGAIDDEHEVFRWDGRPKPLPAWERDHTLQTGLRDNAVWMFQQVARRVGRERMSEALERIEYGNGDIAGGVELFWLQGALRVSAFEQVDFVRRLADGELPMTQRAQRLVRQGLVMERRAGFTLYGLAGDSSSVRTAIAWWVGWVEKKGRPVAHFALNYVPATSSRGHDRFAIGRAILAEAGILPSESRPS